MKIPSGDLAPRRRPRRRVRARLVPLLVALAVLAAAGAVGWRLTRDDADDTVAAGSGCPSGPATPATSAPAAVALPPPAAVGVRLFNGTAVDGLGRSVGDELAARGFAVLSTGNAPAPLAGAPQVQYGPTAGPAALVLAAHVLGADLVPAAAGGPADALDLVLGSSYVRLRDPAEVAAWLAAPPALPGQAAPAAPATAPVPAGCG